LFAETEAVDTGWPRITAAPGGGEEDETTAAATCNILFPQLREELREQKPLTRESDCSDKTLMRRRYDDKR
jgi:hypothetical protein